MGTVAVNIRLDEDTKRDMERLKRSIRQLDEGCGSQHELLDFEDEKPTSKQSESSSILAELDDLRAATPACPSLEAMTSETLKEELHGRY